VHTILRSPDILDRNSDIFGKTFEQFIAQELRAYISYQRKDVDFNFWRSLDKVEVDFVIDQKIAIEVKSARKVKREQLSGLKKIAQEGDFKKRFLVTFDPTMKVIDEIQCLNWKKFLEDLWGGKIF
jgi:predicted AAA+ superfamily ATPase